MPPTTSPTNRIRLAPRSAPPPGGRLRLSHTLAMVGGGEERPRDATAAVGGAHERERLAAGARRRSEPAGERGLQARAAARGRAAVGPARAAAARARRRCGRSRKRPGKVLLIFIVAGLIALILNPVVAFFCIAARLPRGLAVLAVYLAFFLTLAGIGVPAREPYLPSGVQRFADNLPHLEREANKNARAPPEHAQPRRGIHVHFIKQGKTALQTPAATRSAKAPARSSSFGGGAADRSRERALRPGADLRAVGLHAPVRATHRRARATGHAPRRRDAQADDYPALVQNAVSRYVGGQLLFSVIMGTSAGLALYIFGVLGIFPRRPQVRGRVRRLLRLHGADPLHRPDPRRDPAGARGAVHRPDQRAVGHAPVHRPAAARGPRRRAPDLRPHAAHQPAARDLRAAARPAGARHHRRAGRAADPVGAARDRRLPAPSPVTRAVEPLG